MFWWAKLAAFFQKFWETVHALRANETKVTSRNAFVGNIFALESEKNSKKWLKDVLSRLLENSWPVC